jgi:hypothetical protein
LAVEIWWLYFNESEDVDLSAATVELWTNRDEARSRLVAMVSGSGVELAPVTIQELLFTERSMMFDFAGEDGDGRIVGALMKLPVKGET